MIDLDTLTQLALVGMFLLLPAAIGAAFLTAAILRGSNGQARSRR
jgi:hypothetical protein